MTRQNENCCRGAKISKPFILSRACSRDVFWYAVQLCACCIREYTVHTPVRTDVVFTSKQPKPVLNSANFSQVVTVWRMLGIVGGWYIAMEQYYSLCEGAVVISLSAVDIGEEVLVRVKVECGREEVKRGKNDKDKHEETDKERSIKRSSWLTWRWYECALHTLRGSSLAMQCEMHIWWNVKAHEKKSRVRCSCQHPPSVTVDLYRLRSKPTATRRRLISKIPHEPTSNSIQTCLNKMFLKRGCSYPCIVLEKWVLQLVRLTRSVDDCWSRQ